MNIESFNRDLSKKIASANIHEKHDELKKAINAWISITEMTLNASKDPNIDSTYRNMLIKKTEQIFNHIKQLKVKIALPKPDREINSFQDSSSNLEQAKMILEKERIGSKNQEARENNENGKIPEGFLEVKASDEFKILTPHEKLDQNVLKDAKKVYKLDDDNDESESHNSDKIIIEPSKDNKKKICFACGSENAPNAIKCKNCNTDLV